MGQRKKSQWKLENSLTEWNQNVTDQSLRDETKVVLRV